MKARVSYVLVPPLIVVALAGAAIISVSGRATQQRLPLTHPVERLSADLAQNHHALPSLLGFRWMNSEQDAKDEMKLRYIVAPQEGKVAVATLLYTGYRFQPELLGYTRLLAPETPERAAPQREDATTLVGWTR